MRNKTNVDNFRAAVGRPGVNWMAVAVDEKRILSTLVSAHLDQLRELACSSQVQHCIRVLAALAKNHVQLDQPGISEVQALTNFGEWHAGALEQQYADGSVPEAQFVNEARRIVKGILMRVCDLCFDFREGIADHETPSWKPGRRPGLPRGLAHETFGRVLPLILALDRANALVNVNRYWFSKRHVQTGVDGLMVVEVPTSVYPTINKRFLWLRDAVKELQPVISPWLTPVVRTPM